MREPLGQALLWWVATAAALHELHHIGWEHLRLLKALMRG